MRPFNLNISIINHLFPAFNSGVINLVKKKKGPTLFVMDDSDSADDENYRLCLDNLKQQLDEKRKYNAKRKAMKTKSTMEGNTSVIEQMTEKLDMAPRRPTFEDDAMDSDGSLSLSDIVSDSENEYQFNVQDLNSTDSEYEADSFVSNIRRKLQEDSESDDDVPLSLLFKQGEKELSNIHEPDPSPISERTETAQNTSAGPVVIDADSPKKKRKRDEKAWARNMRKTKRNKGEMYITRKGKNMAARQIKEGCKQKCRFKCHNKISEDVRKEIFTEFWALGDITRQRDFIVTRVRQENKKSVSQKTGANKDRRQFHQYYSFFGINVCKAFFTATLAISEQYVKTALKKSTLLGTCQVEQRGRHGERSHEVFEEKEAIREHINSFPRVESHFCRKETRKEYLEGALNKSLMYRMYKSGREAVGKKPASFRVYHDILSTEFNVSFHIRSKDKCAVCAEYENSNDEEKEHLQEAYTKHIESKRKIFESKEKDKILAETNPVYSMAVFDLEEVLSTPKTNVSDAYYMRKLNTYNLTVYDYGTKNAFCFIWPEYIAARESNEVSSCVYQYLQNIGPNKNKIILYSDCCTGQNRNRYMLTMLWYAISTLDFEYIEHKFLQTGHSFNEGDSVHSAIERASKHIDVYEPTHWGVVIQNASHRREYNVKEMLLEDFFDIKELSQSLLNFEIDSDGNKVTWLKIRSMRLNKRDPHLVEIKYEVDGDSVTLNLFQKGRRSIEVPKRPVLKQLNQDQLKIDADKYNQLLKMCEKKIIPRVHHDYYKNIPLV